MIRATLAAVVLLAACTRGEPATPSHETATTAVAPALASQDRDFLERAAQGHNAEVKIAQLAPGRARDARVLALAREIEAHHVAARSHLAALAASRQIALPESLGDEQAAFDRLADLRDDDFDREFVRLMIDDHHQAVLLYRGARDTAVDPAIRAYAAATFPVIERHLRDAQALAELARP